jgi:hypothetical protein
MSYDGNLEQVEQALALLLEAAAILRPLEGEVIESAMLVSRGISDMQRMLNNHCVQKHIADYRLSQDGN